MCMFRVTGINAELHIVVLYLHSHVTTNDTTMLAKKLVFPRIYTLGIIDTNLIKNCGRIRGVGAFNERACGCSVVIFSCSQSMLTEVDK